MPQITVPADEYVRLSQLYSVYRAYNCDNYLRPEEFRFVFQPYHSIDKSVDIREWEGFDKTTSAEENIRAAFNNGDIYFTPLPPSPWQPGLGSWFEGRATWMEA